MISGFNKYCKETIGLHTNNHILLTVSGGVDSMVMLDLFSKSNFKIKVAHCNFQLRGEESERDMQFVEQKCKEYQLPLFVKRFPTKEYAQKNKISIQMAARDLRYAWFESLREEHNLDFIAMAHHLDDQAETFFINLIRGTGIAGLHGILPKKGRLIRPLMFITRAQVEQYALENGVDFVEDSSNASDKYLRNYIRHNLLPLFINQNTNFITNLARTIVNIADIEQVFKLHAKTLFNSMLEIKGNTIILNIQKLLEINDLKPYLSEFLTQYGFNEASISDVYDSLNTDKSGLRFFSEDYRLLKDRSELVITPLTHGDEEDAMDFFIIDEDFNTELPIDISFEFQKNTPTFNSDSCFAYFDKKKVNFPLVLRHWKKGDVFYPFGLSGKKLISDFFIDNKFSIAQKEASWLLCSGEEVMWVVGHRSDNRFRVDENTQEILILKLEDGIH